MSNTYRRMQNKKKGGFDFSSYLRREAVSVEWLNGNEFEIVVGGGVMVCGDKYDMAACKIINNTKFNVYNAGDGVMRFRIVEFFGERNDDFSYRADKKFRDSVAKEYGEEYCELIDIMNQSFIFYTQSGYGFSPESFKEFVRNTFKPLTLMPREFFDQNFQFHFGK